MHTIFITIHSFRIYPDNWNIQDVIYEIFSLSVVGGQGKIYIHCVPQTVIYNIFILLTVIYRKGLGTCDALLCVSHTLQSALESGQEARIVQIGFSAALDGVDHLGILYKLCSVDIGGSVVSILSQFLSNRSQQVMVDGCRSKLVNVVSGVPKGSVLGPLLFLLYTSELFSILENKVMGYADDSTLMVVVPSTGVRIAVAESLIRDLGRLSECCDLWGMKLNVSKTKTMIVSRSCIPSHPH